MDLLHAHYDQFKHELSGQGLISINVQLFAIVSFFWGVPHEVLMMDFWVPGSTTRQELDRFRGKDHFQKILTTSSTTVMVYFNRAINDPNLQKWFLVLYANTSMLFSPCLIWQLRISVAKFQRMLQAKPRTFFFAQFLLAGNCSHINPSLPGASFCQKLSQLTEEQHADLHDVACCWVWIREQLLTRFPGDMVNKRDEMFANGLLILNGVFLKMGNQLMPNTLNIKYTWLTIRGRQMHLANNHGPPNAFG